MYAVFASLFAEISNYQIQISDMNSVPPRFVLKTSKTALEASKQPVTIAGNSEVWHLLPSIAPAVPATESTTPKAPEAYEDDSDVDEGSVPSKMPQLFVGVAVVATCLAMLAVALLPAKRQSRR